MSEPTQSAVGLARDGEGAGSPIGAPPVVAYLRVLAQKDLEEQDWPIAEGETTVGRDAECNLWLKAKSLSRCHASFLVEGGGHFLKDLGSRNRTYRKDVPLRPHSYYELTNGCELILADIQCQYFIGELPEEGEGSGEGEGEVGGDYEQTQMYSFDLEEAGAGAGDGDGNGAGAGDGAGAGGDHGDGTGNGAGDGDGDGEPSSVRPVADQTIPVDSEGSTVGEEGEGEGERMDVEATQAYDFGAGVEGESSEGVRSEGVMDCEPTVAYGVAAVDASEDEDSPASSPLLVGKPPSSPRPHPKADRKVCFEQTVLYTTDDPTSSGDEGETSEEIPSAAGATFSHELRGKGSSVAAGSSKPGVKRVCFESPTLPADTGEETQPYAAGDVASDGGSETDSGERGGGEGPAGRGEGPAERGEEPVERGEEPTVAYNQTGDDDSDVTVEEEDAGVGGRGGVEPTVAYHLEDSPEEDPAAERTSVAGLATADSEETTDGTRGEGRIDAEPTVPYILEESEEDRTEPSAAGEEDRSGGGHGTETASAEQREEPRSQSSDSDLNDTIPAAGDVGRHSRQKTLFGRQSSRGRRGGRRGRGRGRGRMTSEDVIEPSPSDTAEGTTRGKGRGRTTRGRGRAKRTSTTAVVDSTAEAVSSESTGAHHLSTTAEQPGSAVESMAAAEPVSSESTATHPLSTTAETFVEEPRESSSGRRGTRRGRSKGTRGRVKKSAPTTRRSAASGSAVEADSGSVVPTTTSVEELSDESPDISIPPARSPAVAAPSTPVTKEDPLASSISPASSSTGSISTAGSQGSKGNRGGGRRGRGRGASVATPKKGRAAKPAMKSETPSILRHKGTPEHPPPPSPRVLFTGVVDKEGERTLRQLGGELVHSVFECTHLVTDKVRRTVKFLCCLSRGCHLVSTDWLDQCRCQRRLLPPEPFTLRDRPAERQYGFSLNRSLQSARLARVLAGYKVFLTPNVRPECKDMADIIRCSGGEVLSSLPHTPGEGVIIVTCEGDLSMCREAMEARVPVHSTELILGGVLKQELDLHSCHLMSRDPSRGGSSTSAGGSSRKRKGKEPAGSQPTAKRRKKG